VIGKASALIINGGFRYVDSYFDGFNDVPWTFDVQGGVTMVGLPFNRTSTQVYPIVGTNNPSATKFAPIDNAGSQAWAEVQGSGAVSAGGGFDYTFPQATNYRFIKLDGRVGVSFVPKGAPIGAPPPGATAEQYATVVQGHANNWTVAGTVSGQICAQIPKVASGCATGVGGISNNGVGGCASFSLPGTRTLQAIAIGFAKGINAIATAGAKAGPKLKSVFLSLAAHASSAAKKTKNAFQKVGSVFKSAGNKIGSGLKSAGSKLKHFFHLARDVQAHAANVTVINTHIVIPGVNYAIGAVYHWTTKQTSFLTTCSNAALLQALSAADVARAAAAGVPSAQVVVRSSSVAPRLFVIQGATAAPDVLVMGPDRRAIRTYGNGFIEPGWIVYKDPGANTTYVEAVAAPKGKWGFVTAPGTSLITSIKTAAGISIPTVKGGLVGTSGKAYKLAYRVYQPGAGDTITLEETDGSTTAQIARLRGTNGTVTYRPSHRLPSPSRVILAVISRGAIEVSVQPVTAINLTQVGTTRTKKKRR
jgi:hypothetical protein